MRDPRFAPRRLHVEHRPGGEVVLINPAPFDRRHTTAIAPLVHWAQAAASSVWLAQRSGAGWREVTFGEGWERVSALAAGLRDLGLGPDRPLLILARNGIDHALITYAAMSQGIPVAPVSPQYGLPGANLARLGHACAVLRPAAVFVDDARAFATGLSIDALAGLPVIAAANPAEGHVRLSRMSRLGQAPPTARPSHHAKYLLTSGSTGLPKAVICTHANLAANAAQAAACFIDPEPPVMVHSAPWSHSLGANAVLHQALWRGGALYIDEGQPVAGRFDETIRNLTEVAPTYQSMVPAGWALFADALEGDERLARNFFSRVRQLQYGGAALAQAIADRIQAVAERVAGERISFGSGYGATETGPTACNTHWPNARMGLIGLPIPGTSVRLVPEGEKLEFRVKGPQVTLGYLGDPERSAQAFDEEGYYRLGDAARLVDPHEPMAGLAFDGRLSENFKLATGAFVMVGELRLSVVAQMAGAITDAVVCGEDREGVGLLLYPSPTRPRDEIVAAARAAIERHNAASRGAGSRVVRALLLNTSPDPAEGEITDKGYIAQALARRLRSADVDQLFAEPCPQAVLAFFSGQQS